MQLRGKIALVTGAAKRIGRQIALALAQKGANLVLHCHSSETQAKELASEIKALGVGCDLLKADLSETAQVLTMAGQALSKKPVDILVNSASIFYKTPLAGVKESDWEAFIATNLKAPFLLSKEIGLAMAKGQGGRIINIVDWSGFKPYKDYAPYCASKGGLITLTKALARDLAPKVTANAVAPGPVLAPSDMSEEEKNAIASTTALGRWGEPQDVANAVVFLAESDFINGTVLVVDGGRSL